MSHPRLQSGVTGRELAGYQQSLASRGSEAPSEDELQERGDSVGGSGPPMSVKTAFQSSSESRVVKQTESCLFITHVICHVLQPAQMINHLILEMSSPN